MDEILTILSTFGTAEEARDAYDRANRMAVATWSLSDFAAEVALRKLDEWLTRDHGDQYDPFAVQMWRMMLRVRVKDGGDLDLADVLAPANDGVKQAPTVSGLPEDVAELLFKRFGEVPVIEPPRRKPPHGQLVVSRAGGAAKRGIGGLSLLCLLAFASIARGIELPTTYYGRMAFTASAFQSITFTQPQVFTSGCKQITFAATVGTMGAAGGAFCELCLNDAIPILGFPAANTGAQTYCVQAWPIAYSTSVAANREAVVLHSYVSNLFDVGFYCRLSAATTGSMFLTATIAPAANATCFDVDGKEVVGRGRGGSHKGDGPPSEECLRFVESFVATMFKYADEAPLEQRAVIREGAVRSARMQLDADCQAGNLLLSSLKSLFHSDGKKEIGATSGGSKKGDGPGPIPKAEWLKEHPKAAAMSAEKRDAAYDEAMLQRKGQKPRSVLPKSMPKNAGKAVKVAAAAKSRMSVSRLADNPYTRCVLDPFHAEMARVPDLAPGPTKLFKLKQTLELSADTNGRAMIFLRPGLGNAIATSGPMSDASVIWSSSQGVAATAEDLPEVVWDARSVNGMANYWGDQAPNIPEPPDWSNGAFSIQRFRNWDKTVEMVNLNGSTRVVSAGMSARNIANAFEKQGRIVGLQWRGDMGAPGFSNQNIDLGAVDPLTGVPSGPIGVTIANIANLQGSIQARGADGMTIHSIPTGSRAMTDFRQTSPQPTIQNKAAIAYYFGDADPDIDPVPIPFPPAVMDSAATQAFCDIVGGLNPGVSSGGATVTAAPATGVPSQWTDDISAGNTVSGFAGCNLYGRRMEGAADAVLNADNAVSNRTIVQNTMLRVINDHVLAGMSPGDCGLLLIFDGLKPSTKVVDGAGPRYLISEVAEPFIVEIVQVIEAVPRTGTVEFENAHIMPPHAALAAPLVKAASIEVLKQAPVGHRGPHETELDDKGRTSSATPAKEWIKDATTKAGNAVSGVAKFFEQNGWIADAAEALFAFL
jgi:hypothetical protein